MKIISKFLSAVLSAAIVISSAVICPAKAESDTGAMNIDVVFVIDASGTMETADNQHLAAEAAKLFIDLCDKDSCRAGYYFYSHEEEGRKELVSLSDANEVNSLKEGLSSVEYLPENDTDIALGLKGGKDILYKSMQNESRNSVIVLISDGKTDIDRYTTPDRNTETAQNEISDVVNDIKDSVTIYTIGLCTDKERNPEDVLDEENLRKMADDTGGEYKRAENADELPNIMTSIFSNFNRTEKYDIPCKDATEISSGRYSVKFNITNDSISRCNIILRNASAPVPKKTEGSEGFDLLQLNANKIITSKYYNIVSLAEGIHQGEYTIEFSANNLNDAKISLINIYSVYAYSETMDTNITAGESVNLNTFLMDGESPSADEHTLASLSCTAYLEDVSNNNLQTSVAKGLTEIKDGTYTGKGFSQYIPIEHEGTYLLYTILKNDSFEKKSNVMYINAGSCWNSSKAEITLEPNKNASVDEKIKISAKITDEKNLPAAVSELSAKCTVTDPEGNVTGTDGDKIIKEINSDNNELVWYFTPDKKGRYKFNVSVYEKNNENDIREAVQEINVISKAPYVKTPVNNITLYAPPSKFKKNISLSDYIYWDKDEPINVSISSGSDDIFSIDTSKEGNDYTVSLKGLSAGSASRKLIITDSSDRVCELEISAEVKSGMTFLIKYIIIAAAIILIIIIILVLMRPKFSKSAFTIKIVPGGDERSLAVETVNLPDGKTSMSLYDAVAANNLNNIINNLDKFKIKGIMKNTVIKAGKNGRLTVSEGRKKPSSELSSEITISFGDEDGKIILRKK